MTGVIWLDGRLIPVNALRTMFLAVLAEDGIYPTVMVPGEPLKEVSWAENRKIGHTFPPVRRMATSVADVVRSGHTILGGAALLVWTGKIVRISFRFQCLPYIYVEPTVADAVYVPMYRGDPLPGEW